MKKEYVFLKKNGAPPEQISLLYQIGVPIMCMLNAFFHQFKIDYCIGNNWTKSFHTLFVV